jgi:hypothetical protein
VHVEDLLDIIIGELALQIKPFNWVEVIPR